ncbi:MAG: HAD family phosphatase, partial [Myxococcaceae bacterium]|nr:HAD family phosphatase [Myxococcaceae bacterium]
MKAPPVQLRRAVLFDLDGVLVKSHEAWFRAVEESGRRFRGRAITREEFDPTFGQGTAADVQVFGLSCTPAQLDAFYVEEFVKHLATVWVNPDAADVMARLEARGIARALVTNSVGPIARALLAHGGLELPVLATADRVPYAKPAPDLVLLACRELGV